jgi:hypothetical protein
VVLSLRGGPDRQLHTSITRKPITRKVSAVHLCSRPDHKQISRKGKFIDAWRRETAARSEVHQIQVVRNCTLLLPFQLPSVTSVAPHVASCTCDLLISHLVELSVTQDQEQHRFPCASQGDCHRCCTQLLTTSCSMASSKPQAPHPIRLGIVLFPGFEPLDAVGPANVFGAVEGIEISWIAEQQGPVSSKTGRVGRSVKSMTLLLCMMPNSSRCTL